MPGAASDPAGDKARPAWGGTPAERAAAARRAARETKRAETAAAELRGRAEAEKEGLRAAAAAADVRAAAAAAALQRLEGELRDYKARPCFGRRSRARVVTWRGCRRSSCHASGEEAARAAASSKAADEALEAALERRHEAAEGLRGSARLERQSPHSAGCLRCSVRLHRQRFGVALLGRPMPALKRCLQRLICGLAARSRPRRLSIAVTRRALAAFLLMTLQRHALITHRAGRLLSCMRRRRRGGRSHDTHAEHRQAHGSENMRGRGRAAAGAAAVRGVSGARSLESRGGAAPAQLLCRAPRTARRPTEWGAAPAGRQGRAVALLKAKEAELRTAREDAGAALAGELAAAQAAAAAAEARAQQARRPRAARGEPKAWCGARELCGAAGHARVWAGAAGRSPGRTGRGRARGWDRGHARRGARGAGPSLAGRAAA